MRAIARIHGEISMILQLNGQLTPAYKQFKRLAQSNPYMTVMEFVAVRHGVLVAYPVRELQEVC